MKRSKNFLILVVVLSLVAIALVVAHHGTRQPHPPTQTAPSAAAGRSLSSPAVFTLDTPPVGTPSAAAQKRAKDFNDATSRFNAPDGQ